MHSCYQEFRGTIKTIFLKYGSSVVPENSIRSHTSPAYRLGLEPAPDRSSDYPCVPCTHDEELCCEPSSNFISLNLILSRGL